MGVGMADNDGGTTGGTLPGGPAYPPIPPPPALQAQVQAQVQPPAPDRPRSRTALYTSLAVAGFLVIVAGTAGTVVALGRPGVSSAQAGAAATPSVRPVVVATPTATATVKAVVPTVAPAPVSTVKGSVSGDSHSGDLRFFLLPVPSGAQVIGDPDGTSESLQDLADEMNDPSQGLTNLKSWNCSGGADRQYRSSDGTLTIRTELLHFDDDSDASGWASGFRFTDGTSFSVPGIGDAQGRAFDPSDAEGAGSIVGWSHDGDVMYEIEIDGVGRIDRSLLGPLMRREEQLLSTGH
jgi:hypothetical protein